MTRLERATVAQKILDNLYEKVDPALDFKDPYTLLVAVLLSAQCTDKRVNEVTPKLFSRADTPKKMMKVPVDEIYEIIRPCGLGPRKSKAISELSKILVEQHNSQVPKNLEDLEKLPGVGHKTAQVVVAQAYGIPAFPVDTHIHRLAKRWGLSNGKNVTQTEKDLKSLYDESLWNKLHLQIIYYGREYCQARKCFGLECQICKELYPKRKSKVK